MRLLRKRGEIKMALPNRMVLPKGYTKGQLLLAVTLLTEPPHKYLHLSVSNLSTQVIVDRVVRKFSYLDPAEIAAYNPDMLDTFAAFGIIQLESVSKKCLEAIKSKTDTTVWAKNTTILPTVSKSKKGEKMGKKDKTKKKKDKAVEKKVSGSTRKTESEDGLGIIASIADFIKKAGEKGITFDILIEKMCEKFSYRDCEKMKRTINVQVMTKKPPLRVEKDRKVRIDFTNGAERGDREFFWVSEASEEQIEKWKNDDIVADAARTATKVDKAARIPTKAEDTKAESNKDVEMTWSERRAAKKARKKAKKKAAKNK